jgi:CubicO group peptidase (beta-lactamase class C family)
LKKICIKKVLISVLVVVILSSTITAFFVTGENIDHQQPSVSDQDLSILLRKNQHAVLPTGLIDTFIEKIMERNHISAVSAAIVHNDELLWTHGYGLADRERNKPAEPTTIYLVASISKTMTATALMQLYEQGLFDLDDDINTYLNFSVRNPRFPDVPITFRMVLSHHSSIAVDPPTLFTRTFPGDLIIQGYPFPFFKELFTPEGIHYVPQMWMENRPGEEMYYANLGFGLLGYLVERISGQSFENYCQEHIFHPLEMYNTSFFVNSLASARLARPYEYYDNIYYPYIQYNMLDYPAGGLRTTVVDLSHFLIAQMQNGTYKDVQLLTPESISIMHTVQYQNHTGYNFEYGLGFQIWETQTGRQIGHSGGLFGVATLMVYRETDNTGLIMFLNKGINTLRDQFAFATLEHLLFLKALQYGSLKGQPDTLTNLVKYNSLLTNDFPNGR